MNNVLILKAKVYILFDNSVSFKIQIEMEKENCKYITDISTEIADGLGIDKKELYRIYKECGAKGSRFKKEEDALNFIEKYITPVIIRNKFYSESKKTIYKLKKLCYNKNVS